MDTSFARYTVRDNHDRPRYKMPGHHTSALMSAKSRKRSHCWLRDRSGSPSAGGTCNTVNSFFFDPIVTHWRSFFKRLPISSANFVRDWPRSLYREQYRSYTMNRSLDRQEQYGASSSPASHE